MDVKLAFLNGYLEDEIYIKQPLIMSILEKKIRYAKFKKTLCELKKKTSLVQSYRKILLEGWFQKIFIRTCCLH